MAEIAPQTKITVQIRGIAGSKNNHLGRSRCFAQGISRGRNKIVPKATKKVTLPITILDPIMSFPKEKSAIAMLLFE
jgi:hypothetical protein